MLDRLLARDVLRRERDRSGGKIIGKKLYPLTPILTLVKPLDFKHPLQRAWYVIQTEPHREQLAHDELIDRKFDCYWPKHTVRVTRRSGFDRRPRHILIERSLFPSYVFAGFDVACETWQIIQTLRGVHRILMLDMRPVPVPFHIVEHVRQREAESKMPEKRRPSTWKASPFARGTIVRILEPLSFAGLFGEVVALEHDRIRVEIDLFGRKVPLEIQPSNVELA